MTILDKNSLKRSGKLQVDTQFAALDLILVIGMAAIVNVITYFASRDYAGPITAVCTLVFATCLMSFRGIRWSDFGLSRPESLLRLSWQVVAVLLGAIAVGIIAGGLGSLFLSPTDVAPSRTGDIEGNLMVFIGWVALGWIVGGFAEEMLMRGFLLNRFESVLKNTRFKTALAVSFQAVMFGLVHYYNRGALGAWTITAVGLVLGTFYIWFGRKLWPVILAHGFVDTLSFLEDYVGA